MMQTSSSCTVHEPVCFTSWESQERRRSITIYISRHSRPVHIQGKKLLLGTEESVESISLQHIRRIVFLGRPKSEGEIIYTCMRQGISVDFLDVYGRPLGVAMPVIRDVAQVSSMPDMQRSLVLAKHIISAKVQNAWYVLHRKVSVKHSFSNIVYRINAATNMQELRGIEGMAARIYFSYITELVSHFAFSGRKARPAPDPINMMLSFGYGMLHNRLVSALQSCGLNAKQGFFHRGRGAHCALASDLIEDMRFSVDRLVLRLVRLKQVQPKDFRLRLGNCTFANANAHSLYMEYFEKELSRIFRAPCVRPGIEKGDNISMNMWIDATALEYRRWLEKHTHFEPLRMVA